MATIETATRPLTPRDVDFKASAACLNCGALRSGPFCAQCGQQQVSRLSYATVIGEALHTLTSFDSKFARTVIGMTVQPGETVRNYIAGRRVAYINPVRYAFICITLYVVLVGAFDVEFYRPDGWRTPASETGFTLVMSLVGYLIFIELLPSAGLQRLLFRKAPYHTAECYAAQLFVYGHALWYSLLLALVGVGATPLGLLSIRFVPFALLFWTLAQLYRQSTVLTLTKALVVHLVYLFFSVVTGFAAVRLYFWFIHR